ncbi:NUMOD4 domain-containing protein [Vaginella massiliensis]|uniref:NUMOD4 domain-containing protein n=1 Tax=Vaginella massiliensis TaxID=1816680 RepID=UPI00083919C2|nr:NUMOD4 domain-containing protein [Vaginella massiliensis]
MFRIYPGETFKEVHFEPKRKKRYAISNFGRFISFTNSFEDGVIIKGSMTEGYRLFRYKNFKDGKASYGHRFFSKMVAENFLEKTSEDQVYVLHLDYNKDNDYVKNLKWATKEEMYAHQKNSPFVKQAIEERKSKVRQKGMKLTLTQVMRIKKKIENPNRKTRLRLIAKEFGISEMQLYRIKRGENWGNVKVNVSTRENNKEDK